MTKLSILYSECLVQVFRFYKAKVCPVLKADSSISIKKFVFCFQISDFGQLFHLCVFLDLLEKFVHKVNFAFFGLSISGLWFGKFAEIQLKPDPFLEIFFSCSSFPLLRNLVPTILCKLISDFLIEQSVEYDCHGFEIFLVHILFNFQSIMIFLGQNVENPGFKIHVYFKLEIFDLLDKLKPFRKDSLLFVHDCLVDWFVEQIYVLRA